MNTTESLIVLDGWSITIPPTAEQARAGVIALLDSLDLDGAIPTTELGQGIAQEIVGGLAQAKTWMAQVEEMSKQLRQPYFDHAKKIKATSDAFLMPLAERIAKLGSKVADYEAEKKRIEIRLEQQRQAEAARLRREEEERQRAAEAERQRQEQAERDRLAEIQRRLAAETDAQRRAEGEAAARKLVADVAAAEAQREAQRQAEQQTLATIDTGGLRYDAPKTEGVQVKVAYEFEVENKPAFARWCWDNGLHYWIRQLEFAKREITEYLNAPEANRNIPGIRVFQAVGATVRKARTPKTINVATVKTEL